MKNMRFRLKCWAAAGVLVAGPVFAQWDGWDYAFEREIKPWAEMQVQIPAYPTDDTLIPLDVGSATSHRFFIDGKSVSTGSDGVVRYTLVIKTAGGATNVSFEGIRCETREQRYYAIGNRDGTWVRARNSRWRRIEFKEVNAHHITFYGDYACRGKVMVESAEQIVQALRRGPSRDQSRD
ncbi:MAG: hypothetical protein EHM16_02920 [Betaproteobacteria bacterium]|nr:MAG: hypothetical protein EHM16_02920 [Betaproteobacteria bacterium]